MKDLNYKTYHPTTYHPYPMSQHHQQPHHNNNNNYNHHHNDHNNFSHAHYYEQQNSKQQLNHYNGLQLTSQQSQILQQQQILPTHRNYQQQQQHQRQEQFIVSQRQEQQQQHHQQQLQQSLQLTNQMPIKTNNYANTYANKFVATATTTTATSSSITDTYSSNSTYIQQFCDNNNIASNSYNNYYNNNDINYNSLHTTSKNSCFQQQQQQTQAQAQEQTHITDCNAITNNIDKFSMDANEIVNFLANELFKPQLVSVDGIQSGVPTLTTSTLTPTTLRNIDETFVALTNEPTNFPNQAGFKPPPLAPFASVAQPTLVFNNNNLPEYIEQHETASEDSRLSWNGPFNEESSQATTDNSSAATDTTSLQNGLNGMGNNSLTATSTTSSTTNDFTAVNIVIAAQAAANAAKNGNLFGTSIPNSTLKNANNEATGGRSSGSGRRGGGRRPTQAANASPEEEEKRRLRRERNKLAAARCRKRRVDQTNELLEEVALLEKKRETLGNEIQQLTKTKEELEYVLDLHRPACQKMRQDLLNVNTFSGLITPTTTVTGTGTNSAITGIDTTLASTGNISPIEFKPVISDDSTLQHIKNEPLDSSSLDGNDGPTSPKRLLPNVATLQAAMAASLNTPIVTTAPASFSNYAANSTLNALNKTPFGMKPTRPNSLPMPRNLAQNLSLHVEGKPPTEIHGVPIQTPSTGMFNFDSLMDGGTGLTPVSGPLVPTCSSQNKHPLELTTPTSEPSKLVSL